MAGTRRLNQLVESALERLVLPDAPLVVALSGGADSAALAFLCVEVGREARCLHVDHALPGSPRMERAAVAVARTLNLDLDVRSTTVPSGPSPEGQARRARYEEFAEATSGEESLLTAHTHDDDVETVLFNVIRGTGPKGLAGIPYRRLPNVFRPMLSITRSEARETAALAGLPFVDDPMNDDLSLTRNIVRSRIIPMLSELNPRFSESIRRMAAAIASDNEYLDREAEQPRVHRGEGTVGVAIGDLLSLARPIGDRVLKSMLDQAIGAGGVTSERVGALWSVARGEVESQQIGAGFTAVLRGPLLVIESLGDREGGQAIPLDPGHHRQGHIEFEVVEMDGVCQVVPLSRWAAIFPVGTALEALADGWVTADGEPAWRPGERRLPVAWYEPGSVGYLSVVANEVTGWTSGP